MMKIITIIIKAIVTTTKTTTTTTTIIESKMSKATTVVNYPGVSTIFAIENDTCNKVSMFCLYNYKQLFYEPQNNEAKVELQNRGRRSLGCSLNVHSAL